jgi:hypothetical protein
MKRTAKTGLWNQPDLRRLSLQTKDLVATVFGRWICKRTHALLVLRVEAQWKLEVCRVLENEKEYMFRGYSEISGRHAVQIKTARSGKN